MWQDKFKILLINLETRPDRFTESAAELSSRGISFERVMATPHANGAYGLFLTMLGVFERAEREEWGDILIFEDDIQLASGLLDERMEGCLNDLAIVDWDMFYMGGNVNSVLIRVPECKHLLKATSIMSTHAVAYSKQGWGLALQEMRRILTVTDKPEAIDLIWSRVIHPRGNTYISSELLATQRTGFSDIKKRNMDYSRHIQDNFNKRLKQVR